MTYLRKIWKKEIDWTYRNHPELVGANLIEIGTITDLVMGGWTEVKYQIEEFQEKYGAFGSISDIKKEDMKHVFSRVETPPGFVYAVFQKTSGENTFVLIPVQKETNEAAGDNIG